MIDHTSTDFRSIDLLRYGIIGFGYPWFGTRNVEMTNKEKAIGLIQSLNDDVSLDDVIDRLYLLRKVEKAERQADRDQVIEHDEFISHLEAEDAD